MSDNYFKTGLENLKKIDGTAGSNVIENLSDIAPIWPAISLNLLLARFTNVPGSVCRNENPADAVQPFDCRLRSPAAGTYQRSITCWHKKEEKLSKHFCTAYLIRVSPSPQCCCRSRTDILWQINLQ